MPAFKAGSPIYQQIEQKADLHQPAVYQLLSFYQALEKESEPLDNQFVPLTTVIPRAPGETKIFAIGLLPPPAVVTDTILDRSASISAADDPELESEEFPGPDEVTTSVKPNGGVVDRGHVSSPFGPRQLRGEDVKPHLGCDIAAPLGSAVRAAADGVIVSIAKDGVRDGYGNTVIIEHPDGKGTVYAHLSAIDPGISIGMQVVGGTVIGLVGQTSAKHPQPAPHLHFEVLSQVARGPVPKKDGIILNKDTPKRLEPTEWLSTVGRAVSSSKSTDKKQNSQQTFVGSGAPTPKWTKKGASDAQKAGKTSAQVANKSLNQTNLGKAFMSAQQANIKLMRAALEQMAKTPPLRLLVNPQSFRVSAEKVVSNGNWGRNGPIIEHWGENQDKIEGSGKIAAFYAMDVNNANGPGLTRTARQFSTSYQNLLSLFLLYKNNGGVWFPDPLLPASSRVKNLSIVGSVYIYYDEILYIGSFDSLSISESDGAPFSLEYSFSFTVRAWYLLDHLDDQQYTYGRKGAPSLPTGTGGSPLSGGNNPQPSPAVGLPATTFSSEIAQANDPLFGLNEGDIGDDLEGIV